MGDVDDRRPGSLVDPGEFRPQVLARLHVERGERFVQQQRVGLHDECPGDRRPLLLPAREGARVAVEEMADVQEVGTLLDLPADMIGIGVAGFQPEPDVCLDRQVRKEHVVLVDHADVPPPCGDIRDVLTVEEDPARIGAVNPGYRLKEDRLSRTGGAEDDEVLSVRDRERDIGEPEFPEAL